jgi:hypothetical protein
MKKITPLFIATISCLSLFAQTVKRVPLFEVFTSSTCPPCKTANEKFQTVVNTKPDSEYVAIKYQEWFPGTGDPYHTAEAKLRMKAYVPGTSFSIPMERVNGSEGTISTNSSYDAALAEAPLYDIKGTYYVDLATKLVTAKINFKSLGTVSSPVLYVAIIENVTTKNQKTNGETKFYDVMKKMLPTQAGTPLTANTNWESLSFTFQFMGNYRLPTDGATANNINHATEHSVEEFTDIRVVAWIQGSDKVYQAYNLILSSSTTNVENINASVKNVIAFPNPATDGIHVSFTSEKPENVSFLLIGVDGSIIQSFDRQVVIGNNEVEINTSTFANGTYFLSVIDSKKNAYTTPVMIAK